MKAVSVAHTIPRSSGSQKPFCSSPRTPRHSGVAASSSVQMAASLRIARQMCPTVAAKVSPGDPANSARKSPFRAASCRKKLLIG
eukprot:4309868-Prymnesium_polylepis.1